MEELLAKWRDGLPRYRENEVRSDEIIQGAVLWLPPLERALRRHLRRTGRTGHSVTHKGGSLVDNRLMNHPIVVVSRPAATPQTIDFLSMTSFGDRSLQTKFPALNDARRGDYVPVNRTTRHPNTFPNDWRRHHPAYKNLHFKHGYPMQRRYSYVHLSMVYTMHLEDAERYWGVSKAAYAHYQFDNKSLRTLFGLLRAKVPSYRPGVQHVVSAQEKLTCSDRNMRRRVLWWCTWEHICLLVHIAMMAIPYVLVFVRSGLSTTAMMWYARVWVRRRPWLD